MDNTSSFIELELFEQSYQTKVWDERLDTSGKFLMGLAQKCEWDKIVWAFCCGPVDFIWGYIDVLPKDILEKQAYRLGRRLLEKGSEEYAEKALNSAMQASSLPNKLLYNSLILGSCEKDDAEVFGLAVKLFKKWRNDNDKTNALMIGAFDAVLDHHCYNILARLKEQEEARIFRLGSRALRCVNLKNHKGLEMALAWHKEVSNSSQNVKQWTLKENADFFGAVIKNPSKDTWDVLKRFGFLEESCKDLQIIQEMGGHSSSLVFSENENLSFSIVCDCIQHWEHTHQEWITPFIGEMGRHPICLEAFLKRFPQYNDEALLIVGRHYVLENKKLVGSLYSTLEKQLIAQQVPVKNEHTTGANFKKM